MPNIGRSVIRKDVRAKAEGKSLYVADILLPRMLHAAVLRSPHPHARIECIHIEKAKSIDGIEAIMTSRDIPGKNQVHIVFDDMPLLASETVRYVGEPVVLVAARDEWTAWRALSSIDVKYEPLPALFDFRKAQAEDAPRLHASNNVFAHHHIHRGDIDEGRASSAAVVEGLFETPYQEHAYIETQGMLAIPKADGSIEISGSMQCPFYVQEAVSDVCGLPLCKVIIQQAETGGAFGGKEDVPSLVAGHAAILALKTLRPVRMIYRRDEDFISMSKRHPSQVKMEIGCDPDGKLTFIEAKILLDGGAYATLSPIVLWRSVIHASGPYVHSNVRIDGDVVATNNIPCGAFRGFGSPQVLFAIESLMDELALKMNMDPLSLRKINLLKDGQMTSTGQRITGSCGLTETLIRAEEESDWATKRIEFKRASGPVKKGLGAATIFYGVGLGAGGRHLARTGAFLQIAADASVQISVGTAELGQGMQSVLAQITADGLGISYENIHVLESNTSRVPDSGPTVASRATTMSGLALLDACEQAKAVMLKVAAELSGQSADSLTFSDGHCHAMTQGRSIALQDVIIECHRRRLPMAFQGFALSPDTNWDAHSGTGQPYVVYAYATLIAEVSIDTRTGEVIVDKIWAAHDVGKAIHPLAIEGQIQGGGVQGMGFALMEDYRLKNGKAVNPDLSGYLIPNSTDAPDIIPIIVEHAYDRGPFGAKGFGEQPLMGIAPAVTNAIRDAIGVRFYQLPVTPEMIWKAMGRFP